MRIGTAALAELCASLGREPAIVTERGELFLSERSFGAIRLKVPTADYLRFVNELPAEVRPKVMSLVLLDDDKDFQMAVMASVKIREGKTFIRDREVVLV